MTREDLVFVGIRLLGLYFLLQSVYGLLGLLTMRSSFDQFEIGMNHFVPLAGVAVGAVLVLYAPRLESWLSARDRRVSRRGEPMGEDRSSSER